MPKGNPGQPRKPASEIGVALDALKIGESATFTRPLAQYHGREPRAGSVLSASVASYLRRLPDVRLDYATFTAVTSEGVPIVGVIVTRTA